MRRYAMWHSGLADTTILYESRPNYQSMLCTSYRNCAMCHKLTRSGHRRPRSSGDNPPNSPWEWHSLAKARLRKGFHVCNVTLKKK